MLRFASYLPFLWIAAAGGCGDSRELVLDGPTDVKVRSLGPVEGPRVLLSDGSAPEPLTLVVDRPEVATVDVATVTAVGPGKATVSASWGDRTVSWSLVVDPPVSLRFVDPPATLTVGQRQPLHVEARMGTANVDPGDLIWASGTPDVLEVTAGGEAIGKAAGTAYATVKRGESEATVEIVVVAGSP